MGKPLDELGGGWITNPELSESSRMLARELMRMSLGADFRLRQILAFASIKCYARVEFTAKGAPS